MHAKRVFKDFEIKHLGEGHDLYRKSHRSHWLCSEQNLPINIFEWVEDISKFS